MHQYSKIKRKLAIVIQESLLPENEACSSAKPLKSTRRSCLLQRIKNYKNNKLTDKESSLCSDLFL